MLKTLKAEEKADWPSHLLASVFAYNATPHASTSYQPYQLMFGHRVPAPCDNWLGLCEYNEDKSVTRIDLVDQQLEQLINAKKCAQKNIKASNSKNQKVFGGKDLLIPVGTLVLLCTHHEGRNKIQNNNKDQIYVVIMSIKMHTLSNQQVNRCEMCQKQEEEEEEENKHKDMPLYQPSVARKRDIIPSVPHPYNLRSRKQKPVNTQAVLMSMHL